MKNLKKINPLQAYTAIIITGLLVLFVFSYISKISLAFPLLLIAFGVYLAIAFKNIPRLFLQLGLLITLLLFACYYIINYSAISYYYIPVAAVAMLVALLFNDRELVFVVSVISALLAGIVADNSFHLSLVFLFGSLTAGAVVFGARRRSQIIKAGFYGGLVQLITPILLNPSKDFIMYDKFIFAYALPLVGNGLICAAIATVTLPIFEYLFKVLTNVSLLELTDFNHPILKEMVAKAPGTYHHSLLVGNMAEAAANSIGANALFARVGSYYHDIGKIEKAAYFSENQTQQESKHEKLQSTMSKTVILSHVKEGIELAKKYRLNPLLIDFIAQHHGTSLAQYFYWRALQNMEDEDKKVEEEVFRYPGPKPQKREIAIVLLADSVEAATRTLEEPTPSRIEEMVRKIINNKFIDGQLDECELTLKDLEKISETFVRVLVAVYHPRIKYPEKKDEADHQQPAEKDHKPEEPKDSGQENPAS